MSKCYENDNGMHTFTFSHADQEEDPIVQKYITCIACGERRAIGLLGDLLVRRNRQWEKMEPEDE